MNGYTKGYSTTQIADLYSNYYGVPASTLNQYFGNFGNDWGNVALALELSHIFGISVPEVFGIYRDGQSKGEGWGVMAKRYGIKPGSPAFHRMKNSMNYSSRTWSGIFGDYKKNKDVRIAQKNVYIFDNGVIKSSKGGSKNQVKIDKQRDKNNNRKNNKSSKQKGNTKKGNQGKGNSR